MIDLDNRPQYMSPSSLKCWLADKEEFYVRYLAKAKPLRMPQTLPMAAGSAFDAYVKHYLHKEIMGTDKGHEFIKLFEDQVEEQNRTKSLEVGAACFNAYKVSGMLADLLQVLCNSPTEPRFESKVEGTVLLDTGDGVPLLGKPDLVFQLKCDNGAILTIILDWKVNGYFSKVSPNRGYIMCKDGWLGKISRSHGKVHKDAHIMCVEGTNLVINVAETFEVTNEEWAIQCVTYLWLEGESVGTDAICIIHQLACDSTKGEDVQIRVSDYRGRVSKGFQQSLYNNYVDAWADVQGWEDDRLERVAQGFAGSGDMDKEFMSMTRSQ